MSKRAARYRDVQQALGEKRLRVCPDTGTIERNRVTAPNKPKHWCVPRGELVIPRGRKTGYLRVHFSTSSGWFRCLAHRLVWFALRGDIPEGMTINHLDGNKQNNTPSNLEVVPYADNLSHAISTGLLDPTTPKNWSLSADTVRSIRKRIVAGEPQIQIASNLGVSPNIINRIHKKHTYRSVT